MPWWAWFLIGFGSATMLFVALNLWAALASGQLEDEWRDRKFEELRREELRRVK